MNTAMTKYKDPYYGKFVITPADRKKEETRINGAKEAILHKKVMDIHEAQLIKDAEKEYWE